MIDDPRTILQTFCCRVHGWMKALVLAEKCEAPSATVEAQPCCANKSRPLRANQGIYQALQPLMEQRPIDDHRWHCLWYAAKSLSRRWKTEIPLAPVSAATEIRKMSSFTLVSHGHIHKFVQCHRRQEIEICCRRERYVC